MVSMELYKLWLWFQVNTISLNTSKTNSMVFILCMHEWTTFIQSVCHKIIGCAYGLDWNYHIDIVRNKVAKHISVMNKVKLVLTSSALYSLYCTLVMPYLTYCCEVRGNNYKTRIQSLFVLQKRAIIICLNTDYKCHAKPFFINLDHLMFFDIIYFNSLVFMYMAFHNLVPTHLLTYFKKS